MEKETLEETARRILSKEGVKLHPSGLETYLKGNVINAMVEMAKWQKEQDNNKEDLKDAFKVNYTPFSATNVGDVDKDFNKWFEQFKNN
jgi:NRPS condensation-like uncharacterized protein